MAWKFWTINTMSITVEGKCSFCFDNFSLSPAFSLSTRAKLHSFSNSAMLNDFALGQKKILTPEGEPGSIQTNSACQRQVTNAAPGLNDTLSNKSRWANASFALN